MSRQQGGGGEHERRRRPAVEQGGICGLSLRQVSSYSSLLGRAAILGSWVPPWWSSLPGCRLVLGEGVGREKSSASARERNRSYLRGGGGMVE